MSSGRKLIAYVAQCAPEPIPLPLDGATEYRAERLKAPEQRDELAPF